MAVINLVAMDIKGLWGIEDKFNIKIFKIENIKRLLDDKK